MTRMPNAVIGISLLNRLTPGTILGLGVSVIMGTIHAGNNILPQRNPPSPLLYIHYAKPFKVASK